LQLEITEEFLMTDCDRARDILTRLRQHGFQISVDDFGTGYSSLGLPA
jgi:diguanylate cyclase